MHFGLKLTEVRRRCSSVRILINLIESISKYPVDSYLTLLFEGQAHLKNALFGKLKEHQLSEYQKFSKILLVILVIFLMVHLPLLLSFVPECLQQTDGGGEHLLIFTFPTLTSVSRTG